MSSLKEYRLEQLAKLRRLKEMGIDAYPATVTRDLDLLSVCRDFERLDGQTKWLAGRLLSLRQHGQITFLDLADQHGQLQLIVRQTALQTARHQDNQLKYEDLSLLTRGDFLNVKGVVKKSDRGEKSLEVSELKIAAKVLKTVATKVRRRRNPSPPPLFGYGY